MDTEHPAIVAVMRANASVEPGVDKRDTVRREIEAEAKGLLMAARMHGFSVSIMHGTSTVIDLRGTR